MHEVHLFVRHVGHGQGVVMGVMKPNALIAVNSWCVVRVYLKINALLWILAFGVRYKFTDHLGAMSFSSMGLRPDE